MVKCYLCGQENISLLEKMKFQIAECSNCTFAFIISSTGTGKNVYPEEYYKSWGLKPNGSLPLHTIAMKRKTFIHKLSEIEKYCSKGKVLDVGCATGIFLEVAQQRGWNVWGCEISEWAAKKAKEKFGDVIFQKDVCEVKFEKNFFDLITLFDVIEHLDDPFKFFREIHQIMRPGGIVAIVSPSLTSLSRKLMGKKWINFKEEHRFYFSPKSIRLFLSKLNFKILFVRSNIKYLNLSYVYSQLVVYSVPFLSNFFRLSNNLTPIQIKRFNFPFYTGELFAIAQK